MSKKLWEGIPGAGPNHENYTLRNSYPPIENVVWSKGCVRRLKSYFDSSLFQHVKRDGRREESREASIDNRQRPREGKCRQYYLPGDCSREQAKVSAQEVRHSGPANCCGALRSLVLGSWKHWKRESRGCSERLEVKYGTGKIYPYLT